MIYRARADDFVVHEIARFDPSGDGDHELLYLEKRDRDTAAVASELASLAQCSTGAVGFAGRKDRVAVTRQWFSVPWGALPKTVDLDGVRVLERARHDRRLRVGDLRGNRFVLRVREVPQSDVPRIRERFGELCRVGFDNFFGAQRFGRSGDNAERGRRLLMGEDRIADRRLARLLVSALQSDLFNQVLRLRREEQNGIELVSGDLVRHPGGGALRWIGEPTDDDQGRFQGGITSPTGPLFGAKMRWPRSPADRWERDVLERAGIAESRFAGRKGLKIWGDRRPLRAPLADADLTVEENDTGSTEAGPSEDRRTMVAGFTLLPGCYASVCLEQIFGAGLEDATRASVP